MLQAHASICVWLHLPLAKASLQHSCCFDLRYACEQCLSQGIQQHTFIEISVITSFRSSFKAFQSLRVTAMTYLLRSQQSLASGMANITLSVMRPLCKARIVEHRSSEVAVKRLQLLQNLLADPDTKLDRSIQFRVRHISEVLVDS